MHRLSLANSPSRNLLFRGGNEEETVESRRGEGESRGEIEEAKRERLRRICRKERLVHLIPFVLLFCILVLYIFSYDPTQKGDSKVGDPERFKRNRGIGNHPVLYSHRSLHQAKRNLATAAATASPPLYHYRKLETGRFLADIG